MNRFAFALLLILSSLAAPGFAAGVVYPGGDGPGKGKHIVLVSGDEEYRSEEALPQLAKILAKHHGFKCTVLFAIDPKTARSTRTSATFPGLEALETADLMVIFTRFRNLPDDQMKHIVDYIDSGKPIIGMRTATHAFNIRQARPTRNTPTTARTSGDGGFGRQVLGETWINHHGKHGSQSTRGIIAKAQENHPILRGIKDGDIWGPTDVYGVRSAAAGRQPAAGARPGAHRHEADRSAAGRREERSDDADRLDEDLRRHAGNKRPRLLLDDRRSQRPGHRRHPPPAGQRLLSGACGSGEQNRRQLLGTSLAYRPISTLQLRFERFLKPGVKLEAHALK